MSDKLALARIKRLQKEMEKFETDPPPGCEASMTDPMTIKAKIKGVGPYDGGTYQFKITIPKVFLSLLKIYVRSCTELGLIEMHNPVGR